jgi:hypothetical protein
MMGTEQISYHTNTRLRDYLKIHSPTPCPFVLRYLSSAKREAFEFHRNANVEIHRTLRCLMRKVRWNDGLAIGLESAVESDGAIWSTSIERQGEEDLPWHPLKHKFRHILESEFAVVIRMSDKTTTLGIHGFQP